MQIVYKNLPVYYGSLQKEQGLSFSEIQSLDRQNRVYIGEMLKADNMQKAGKTNEQILNYFRTQGYNAIQVNSINAYLTTSKQVDPTTKKTNSEKLTNTVNQVKTVGLGVAELLTAFGVIKGNAVPQIGTIPFDFGSYSGVPQYSQFGVDVNGDRIITQGGLDVPKPTVTPPSVTASIIPDWVNFQNVALLLLLLTVIYLASNQSSTSAKLEAYNSERSRKR